MDAQHSGINLARQRPFPERAPPRLSGLDAAAVKIFGAIRRSLKQTQRTFQPAGEGIVAAVSSRAPEWAALSDAEVAEEEGEEEDGASLPPPPSVFGCSAATTALLREAFRSAGVLALPFRTSSRTPSTTRRAARGPKSDA